MAAVAPSVRAQASGGRQGLVMRKAGKILVVDDYEPNLRGLGQLLRTAEYSVTSASSGQEALDLAKRERPDLVLLDVLMPGMSGVDVCRELKRSADTCLTPVVLVSGAQERDTILAGLEAGADDFLNKPVDAEELYTRVRSLMRLKRLTDDLESAETLFLTLGRIIEARDPYTEGHCERLADYATALGGRLELRQADIDALYRGAFLHDIGKIAIPDRVLLKRGRLTAKEFASMKRHPAIGDELLASVRSFDRVRPIVRHHHERMDGRGYPDGLRGDAVPLLAQVVSVVDVFDALTTDRLYRKALPVPTAYQMLREKARGGWCQMSLVDCFIDAHRAREVERARTQVAV
ncbi:MAG TPA: HD domain-containing phosphohydrolase [Vicinamibacterales bacterium]|nr:HD domain-containing phosphohydrolase [Vicinamibacterales bacterium]